MRYKGKTPFNTSSGISIVIPAYNEQERLGSTLDRILDFVRLQKWHAEIIVVDGASQDHTADIPTSSRSMRNAIGSFVCCGTRSTAAKAIAFVKV